MSDKIYFNTSGRFSVRRSIVQASTNLHYKLAPQHAKKTARKLLLTPVRTQPKNTPPNDLIIDSINTKYGELKTYQLGQGPIWILSHGWSGNASQFYPLMEHIAAQGFTALAYDHPAHGQSDGDHGHIPAFVDGLDALLDQTDNIAGLVAHSMGTASALESRHPKLQTVPMLLIAPILDYLDNLLGSVRRAGFSMRLFSAVVADIEQQYNYPLQSINPFEKLAERQVKTHIVHDNQDKFAQFAPSERAAKYIPNVELVTTQGLGHGRIMMSQQVKDSFDSLVASQA